MKLSIIIAVLNSFEIFRRQLIHFGKMDLPDDIEIIIMDDGSDPMISLVPMMFPNCDIKNLWIYPTYEKREWTVALARNEAARISKAPYVLMTDLDHFWLKDAIMIARDFDGDKLGFKREFGVLDDAGNFTKDIEVLRAWGLDEDRIKKRGTKCPPHGNSFCMRKEMYWELGGYEENRIGMQYPQLEESRFKGRWRKAVEDGKAIETKNERPIIYQFPNGRFCGDADYNPFGFFHTLSRKNLDPRNQK
jgi:hypothetical protein